MTHRTDPGQSYRATAVEPFIGTELASSAELTAARYLLSYPAPGAGPVQLRQVTGSQARNGTIAGIERGAWLSRTGPQFYLSVPGATAVLQALEG